ncbi:MAG: hypothetical protein RJQ08_11815 [Salinisphaeraceae bacterium]
MTDTDEGQVPRLSPEQGVGDSRSDQEQEIAEQPVAPTPPPQQASLLLNGSVISASVAAAVAIALFGARQWLEIQRGRRAVDTFIDLVRISVSDGLTKTSVAMVGAEHAISQLPEGPDDQPEGEAYQPYFVYTATDTMLFALKEEKWLVPPQISDVLLTYFIAFHESGQLCREFMTEDFKRLPGYRRRRAYQAWLDDLDNLHSTGEALLRQIDSYQNEKRRRRELLRRPISMLIARGNQNT